MPPNSLPCAVFPKSATGPLDTRSQALLRPHPRGPEKAKPLLGSTPCTSILDDPLVQWRLRRCRGEEPALDTPLVGRALLGSAAPQAALQGVPRGRSRDPPWTLQGAVPWESHDPEAPGPITRHFRRHQEASSPQAVSQEPWWQEPCWRSHDTHKAFWPMRSSSLDTLQGALYSRSRDSHEVPWQKSSSSCASLHVGAPPCGKQESQDPLRQEPFWGPHDGPWAQRRLPDWKLCDSQSALRPAREALPEPLHWGGRGLRSCDTCVGPQPIRSTACDALQGVPLQQPLGPQGSLQDPLLRILRCHRRTIRGRLRAIETLLECPPGHPQSIVGPIKK
ncbi:uncharacterized protein LOC120747596 isoform X2 [Hirundo rustica]|uniref:uncharacterized protein LOC120747596 isoform X2 n=1 Tax=Hirundo rustica TaxID=43150 RepID=UPI001A947AB3|nr:uncharacterized protein LOC120747596 isoform X2 [Hirundo rustica]